MTVPDASPSAEGGALVAPAITRRLIEEFVKRPPPTIGVPTRLEALTERELDVSRLLAWGHTNQEIADQLYLGGATIKNRLGHISPNSTSATGPKPSSSPTRPDSSNREMPTDHGSTR